MLEIDAQNAIEYLHTTGRIPREIAAEAEMLAWGVSNIVLRIHPEQGEDFVIKQSREQLRTKIDWFSRLDRIWRETDFMNTLGPQLPSGVIPNILFEDRDNYLFGMEAVDADHVVWKADLLEGKADAEIARTAGEYLSTIHRTTADNAELKQRWQDHEVFIQLRVDPFYRSIARVHPSLQPAVERMIDEMFQNRLCAVHADFSPKNILITRQGVSLVDFETAHFGDPAFDLGFFLSHLMLKTVLHVEQCEEFLNLARVFWKRYSEGLEPLKNSTCGLWTETELHRRTIQHLAGCMLARIDGTSTVDYLPEHTQQDLVRAFCNSLFLDPPGSLDDLFQKLQQLLTT